MDTYITARVISAQRGLFLVTDGQREWLCPPAGKLKHSGRTYPVTGDWVQVEDSVITGVVQRRTFLSRGQAGSQDGQGGGAMREQAIAANIDTVFIVCGLDRDYNLRRIERYLTLVYNCGMTPVIVLTKADLHDDPQGCRTHVESVAFGVPVVLTSMHDPADAMELGSYVANGRTVAMLGSSGAGKSTLANMLYGSDIQATSHVSDSVGKGRHTTTTRQLIRMPQGGMLMDNPGIREIAFYMDGHGIEDAFPEIQNLAEGCRFGDCTHQHEPGCAVLRAAEAGELPAERLDNYHKMRREMDYVSARAEKNAGRVEKERKRDISLEIKRLKKRRD